MEALSADLVSVSRFASRWLDESSKFGIFSPKRPRNTSVHGHIDASALSDVNDRVHRSIAEHLRVNAVDAYHSGEAAINGIEWLNNQGWNVVEETTATESQNTTTITLHNSEFNESLSASASSQELAILLAIDQIAMEEKRCANRPKMLEVTGKHIWQLV